MFDQRNKHDKITQGTHQWPGIEEFDPGASLQTKEN